MLPYSPPTMPGLPIIPFDLESFVIRTYPTPFVHIERWSKVWACFPVTYSYPNRGWKFSPFLGFWVFCSIGLNVPCFYDCMKASVSGDNSLTLYVMILIVVVMSITAVCMHVLTLIYYREWIKFLDGWMKFERKFSVFTTGVHSPKLAIPLFIGFFICVSFFVFNIFNELRFNLINNDGIWRMLSLVYVYVIYSYTLSMPILWVVMASKVFVLCFTHIKTELQSILECAKFGQKQESEKLGQTQASPVHKCTADGDINRLQEAVLELRSNILAFKRLMGPFMLVLMPHHIISLICFLYWTMVSALDYTDWYFPVSFGLLSLQAIAPIFCGAIYSEDVHLKKNALIEPLILLKGTMKDEDRKNKMATLIDHLSRMDAHIEGRGFFTLNKGMATTIVNTVVTYLVVLIQFYGSGDG